MQVGTTKDQGLHNKPSAVVHPGALAAGTLPQYNIIIVSSYNHCFLTQARCYEDDTAVHTLSCGVYIYEYIM